MSQHENAVRVEKQNGKLCETLFPSARLYPEKYKNDRNCAMLKEGLGQAFLVLIFPSLWCCFLKTFYFTLECRQLKTL